MNAKFVQVNPKNLIIDTSFESFN